MLRNDVTYFCLSIGSYIMIIWQSGAVGHNVIGVYRWIVETASVAEWLRAWDTLTMFEATVCGRS